MIISTISEITVPDPKSRHGKAKKWTFHDSPQIPKVARILYNPTDYTKIRATNSSLSPTVPSQSPRNSRPRTPHPPSTSWYSEEA